MINQFFLGVATDFVTPETRDFNEAVGKAYVDYKSLLDLWVLPLDQARKLLDAIEKEVASRMAGN